VHTDDFRINATIRAILVRFWINTSQISHGCVNGVVYLRGRLIKEVLRVEDAKLEEELPFIARRIVKEIMNVRGVRDVVCDLENLKKVRGRWQIRTADQRKTA
jgi:hypothetical protein